MRPFFARLVSYKKTFVAFVVGSLLPYLSGFIRDELLSRGIDPVWNRLGGPALVGDGLTWAASHPLQSLAGAVLAYVVIAASLSERHLRRYKHESKDWVPLGALAKAALEGKDIVPAAQQKQRTETGELLISFHRRGVIKILLKPPVDASGIEEWRSREAAWQQEVKTAMRTRGCGLTDIYHFEVISTFPLLTHLHPDTDIARDMSMLSCRLDRLKEIAHRYAAVAM